MALLVDGLEKSSLLVAQGAIRSLLSLRNEADLVLVLPFELVTGPTAYWVIDEFNRHIYNLHAISVRPEDGDAGTAGRSFLVELAKRRLGLAPIPEGFSAILNEAAVASGGIPRTFLQLVQDAGAYAGLRGREFPGREDLADAMEDHAAGLARLLERGDLAALAAADGTDGNELPAQQKLRFFAHELLLEYPTEGRRTVMRPHPLLASRIRTGATTLA